MEAIVKSQRFNPSHLPKRQGGATLLELMVAIVIFSVGVLGIMGLQITTATVGVDARFRTEAAALADELLAQMQVDNLATSNTNYAGQISSVGAVPTGGTAFVNWANNRLLAAGTNLPNATAKVTVQAADTTLTSTTGYYVQISITWIVPQYNTGGAANKTAARGKFDMIAAIPGN